MAGETKDTQAGIFSEYDLKYSPNSRLNTLDIHHFPKDSQYTSTRYWIVYIHGGAWRDPAIDSKTISVTLPFLLSKSLRISAVASLNYRLSPYPGHATDPSGDDPARNIEHPIHVHDIVTAIRWLQFQYSFAENYLIVGHSAGATLAFQATSGLWKDEAISEDQPMTNLVPPVAIAGVAGIYDLKVLLDSYSTIPAYREFVEGAFGKDERLWDLVSPANAAFADTWHKVKVAIIADSHEDGLIDQVQSDKMFSKLATNKHTDRQVVRLALHGEHDTIWSEGTELARVIIHALELLSPKL